MSDEPAPSKPKPGSLRDRIAAFENKSTSSPKPGPPPVPRPKPGGLTWKPKQPSPPTSPTSPGLTGDSGLPSPDRKYVGGMSASDAMESIGKAGSLKERMAALQGKGAFGAPPPLSPKPAVERPKWKPPPIVSSPAEEEDESNATAASPVVPAKSPLGRPPDSSVEDEMSQDTEGQQSPENDPEEEERQRRAAIAARMARLGGARVGMAPPILGKKPAVRKETAPKEEITSTPPSKEEPSPAVDTAVIERDSEHASATSPPAEESESQDNAQIASDRSPMRKDSESASLMSVESASSLTQGSRTPTSMPVPAVPRRTAPPRRKPAKSSSLPLDAAPDTLETLPEQSHDKPETARDLLAEGAKESEEAKEPEPGLVSKQEVSEIPEDDHSSEEPSNTVEGQVPHVPYIDEPAVVTTLEISLEPVPSDDEKSDEELPPVAAHDHAELESESPPSPEIPVSPEVEEAAVEEAAPEPEEEDEAMRRQRVAERMAKMGAFNPFAPPPQRQASTSSSSEVFKDASAISEELESPSAPPPPPNIQRRVSVRQSIDMTVASSDTAPEIPPPPVRVPDTPARATEDAEPLEEKDGVESEGSDYGGEKSEDEGHQDPAFEHAGQEPVDETREGEPYKSEPPGDYMTAEEEQFSKGEDEIPRIRHDENEGASEDESEPARHIPTQILNIPPPKRHSVNRPPPPSRALPSANEEDRSGESDREHVPPPPLPLRVPPRPPVDPEEDEPRPPLPPPRRVSVPLPPPVERVPSPEEESADDLGDESEEEEILPIPPPARPALPPPPPRLRESTSDDDDSDSPASTLMPPRPAHRPLPRGRATAAGSPLRHPSPPISHEVLDESEGDPIDPSFHSPSKRASPTPSHEIDRHVSDWTREQEASPELAEDEEQSRRRTIAERMAKLGGIKFGAPLPMGRPPPPMPRAEEGVSDGPSPPESEAVEESQQTEEEEEKARKQRIAAKIAGMGGMRFGMLPMGVPPTQHVPTRVRRQESDDSSETPVPLPPQPRAVPPPRHLPPPPPVIAEDADSEQDSTTSDDGVKVEAEESELEEVSYEDAEGLEEVPPPIPTRPNRRMPSSPSSTEPPRRMTQPPPVPSGRPPVPTTPTSRRPPVPATAPRKVSAESSSSFQSPSDRTANRPPSFVMVDDPEPLEYSDAVVLPPKPPGRVPPPARGAPPPPSADSVTLQWELPPIPTSSLDFGGDTDLSLSTWSELAASESSLSAPPPPPKPTSRPSSHIASSRDSVLKGPSEKSQMSAHDLTAMWGRVGVQVCEAATLLVGQSKVSSVGDGTYRGFVDAVLSQVPNAVLPSAPSSYGYLIYARDGPTVQTRACEIMPGDIVVLSDAKLKGHKGIQTYHQTVGVDEEVVGIVGDYEPKKSKIRVFEANQQAGQQAVESVSYRLEDLKSGTIKIYRVLDFNS